MPEFLFQNASDPRKYLDYKTEIVLFELLTINMIQQHIKKMFCYHIKIICNGISLGKGCNKRQTNAYQSVLQE